MSGFGTAYASCPAYSMCDFGSGDVCTISTGEITCLLSIGASAPYGEGTATAIYGNCGSDDYCIWGTTEGGGDFCCSYSGVGIERISVQGGPGDDTISFQYDTYDLENSGDVDVLEGIADGNGGADTITGSRYVGSDYSDKLHGGTGNDAIDGDAGPDFIYGEEDYDTLLGGAGGDTIDGGSESDTIRGQGGDDTVHGGSGQDLISGGSDRDVLYGDGDGDVICADSGGSSTSHQEIYGGMGSTNNLWGGGTYTDIYGDSIDSDLCGNYGSASNCDGTLLSEPVTCPDP